MRLKGGDGGTNRVCSEAAVDGANDLGLSPGCTLLLKVGDGGTNRACSGEAGGAYDLGLSPDRILLLRVGDGGTNSD